MLLSERLRDQFARANKRATKLALSVSATLIPIFVLIAVVLGVFLLSPGDYMFRVVTLGLIYFMIVLGYNLVLTVGGLFHFGFAVHFALGAYVAGVLMVRYGWGTLPVLPVVLLVSGFVTALIAFPTLRFKGDYLCIVTLAFAEIMRQVFVNWRSVTGGPLGLPGIPPPTFFGFSDVSAKYLFAVIAALAVLTLWTYQALVSSRYGLAWEAMRHSEEALEAAGFRVFRYKLGLLVVGSLFAGVAGLAYAHYSSIVDPSLASVDVTVLLIAIVILGGGTSVGLLISSLVLTALPQVFLGLGLYRQLALGLVLIAVMNWRPEGFSLLRKRGYARLKRKPDLMLHRVESPSAIVAAGSTRQLAVETIGLTKRFGGLVAVDQLSLAVPEGSIFGIIGPNGAGKTTLFNLVNGVMPADEGVIRVLGQNVTNWPVWRISRLGVGRTFQNIKLYSTLTVLDNVVIAAAQPACERPLDRKRWEEAVERASEVLEFVGLDDRMQVQAGSLPYADQRRLEIARAIVTHPPLLLLDEPSAGMIPKELDDLRTLVEEVRARGTTVICIEHNMRFILPMADEILVMNEGKRLVIGQPNEISKNPTVVEAYLGRRAIRVAG